MLDNTLLRQVINDQKSDFLREKMYISRAVDITAHIQSTDISVITGVRRCGKSTLLRQISSAYKDHRILYLDLEDPRLRSFETEDFQACNEIWEESQREREKLPDTLLLVDEVQNVSGWEKWIRYFAEKKNYKVYITGSNSQMLSAELGSVLGGRYITLELFPFSIEELVIHQHGDVKKLQRSTEYFAELQSILTQAQAYGLFPKPYLEKSSKIYPTLFENIVTRDIAQRKGIRKINELYDFATLCAKDNTRTFNLKKTADLLSIKNQRTLANYVSYLEQSYLFFRLRPFSRSPRAVIRGGSKFYTIDPVLADAVSVQAIRRTVFLENLIFLTLRRKNTLGYWHSSNGYEVDFIERQASGELVAIQACFDLASSTTLGREVRALLAAQKELRVEKLLIITQEAVSVKVRSLIPETIEIMTYLEFIGVW